MEAVRADTEKKFKWKPLFFGLEPKPTTSIGGVTITSRIGYDEALKRADGVLYKAKKGGKNRVEWE